MEIEELEKYVKNLKQDVLKLTNTRDKLGLEVKDLEENIKLFKIRKEEVEVYLKRIQTEYDQLLTHRRATIKEVEIENNNLVEVIKKKTDILIEIKNNIDNGQKEINKLEKGYTDFIKGINKRENDIVIKENTIREIEQSIDKEAKTLKLESQDLDKRLNEISNIEKTIDEKKNSILTIEDKLKADEILAKNNVNNTNKIKADIEKKKEELENKIQSLERDKNVLDLHKEAVDKEKDSLEDTKKSIEKNRRHLESQQQTLRVAFEEIKKLKNDTN